jgi:hypothetical protein
MAEAEAKIISPCNGSNFIAFEGRRTAEGYTIEPKPFPRATATLMTLGIGAMSAAFLIAVFKLGSTSNIIKTLAIFPALLGTFGPAVALWIQTNYHVSRGTLLRYNAASHLIELPRVPRTLKREDLKWLAIVRSPNYSLLQLQLHAIDGEAFALLATLDRASLMKIVNALSAESQIPVEEFNEESQ